MVSTGIVRKVDALNRVVIPMDLCRTLGIAEKTPMEVFVDGDRIILKKYAPGCNVCGETDGLVKLDAVRLCRKCVTRVAHTAGIGK